MKATIFYKQNETDKQYKSAQLPAPVDAFAFGAFVEQSQEYAFLMSELWSEQVVPTFKHIDRVEFSDYEVKRTVNGDAVTFGASSTVRNTNIDEILKGIASLKADQAALKIKYANLKAMIKAAITETVHGYEAGKRGRTSNKLPHELALEKARAAMKAVKA